MSTSVANKLDHDLLDQVDIKHNCNGIEQEKNICLGIRVRPDLVDHPYA